MFTYKKNMCVRPVTRYDAHNLCTLEGRSHRRRQPT